MRRANKFERRVIIMALHTGRRLGDLTTITWADWDGVFVQLSNSKGGKKREAFHRASQGLTASLEKWKRALPWIPRHEDTILVTPRRLPCGPVYPSSVMSDLKKECGFQDLHFHDVRGTAITVLAENGATNAEIESIRGYSLNFVNLILEKYVARTRALNDTAVARLELSCIAGVGL
jgi:integrase